MASNNEIIEDEIVLKIENLPTPDDNIEVLGSEQDYSLVMYLDKNVEPKYFTKFIKAVEKTVRGNTDYKMYLTALREEPKMSRDAFLYNLSSQEVEIQLHHYPFNLYAIVRIIAEKMLLDDKRVSTFIVADEVIKLHLDDYIGLVPLSVTTHQMAHLGKLEFVRTQIFGQWEKFYNEYKNYMDDHEHVLIKSLLERKSLPIDSEDLKLISNIDDLEVEDLDLEEFSEEDTKL